MSQQNQAHCESDVKVSIKKWETDVYKQLRATRLDILTCCPFERAYHKGKMKSLGEVLDHLHGINTFKMTKKNERSYFPMKLQMVRADYLQIVAKYEAQKRSNKYLKIQLCQQFQLTNKIRKENEMLRHQIKKMRDLQSNRLEESPPVADFEEKAAHKAFEAMLIEPDQRQTITELKKKLLDAERTLHVQRQEDKDCLLKREHEWEEKVKSLEKKIHLHGENTRWPNLFCQLFGGSYRWLYGSQCSGK